MIVIYKLPRLKLHKINHCKFRNDVIFYEIYFSHRLTNFADICDIARMKINTVKIETFQFLVLPQL